MRYVALAIDFDGTLATQGHADARVLAALERVVLSGRKLILVTGRMLEDLCRVLPDLSLFERVVAEDGGILYDPATNELVPLGEPPSDALINALRHRMVEPLSIGKVILATWRPHELAAIEAIQSAGMEHQVIFNRDAVMIAPPGINKATGLQAALDDLCLSPRNVVSIGDAENDHAFLHVSEFSAAAQNALPSLKAEVDFVTNGTAGDGVIELADRLIIDDLISLESLQHRRGVLLGRELQNDQYFLTPHRHNVLVTGPSGSGKSRAVLGFVERSIAQGYQVCVIDPEGDFGSLSRLVSIGNEHTIPSTCEVIQVLQSRELGVVVNLTGLSFPLRPAFFDGLYRELGHLWTTTGRPHWVVIDEAHHLFPVQPGAVPSIIVPPSFKGLVLATVHPAFLEPTMLAIVDVVVVLGPNPEESIAAFCQAIRRAAPALDHLGEDRGDALVWRPTSGQEPTWICLEPCNSIHIRHRRKYAAGDLGLERSFYFRGPQGSVHLRAKNLLSFVELTRTVADEIWLYHLRRGDYSRWIEDVIADHECARAVRRIEIAEQVSSSQSRERIVEIIEERYTLPA